MKEQPESTKQTKKAIRERIATAILMERLHLNEDWHDPDFSPVLPARLSPTNNRKLSRDDVGDVKEGIKRLVDLGCNKRVLCWCLEQLSNEAESFRQGDESVVVLDAQDEALNREYVKPHPLATRQDMKEVAKKASILARVIRKYRRELDLVLDAVPSIPLPEGMVTEPPDAIDAVDVLLAYLTWVKKLALAWESPFPNALMKSKGPLFLLVYVWTKVRLNPVKAGLGKVRASTGHAAQHRLPPAVAQEIANLADAFAGSKEGNSLENLNDKLQDCAVKEPEVFKGLVALMERLDETAAPAASSQSS